MVSHVRVRFLGEDERGVGMYQLDHDHCIFSEDCFVVFDHQHMYKMIIEK